MHTLTRVIRFPHISVLPRPWAAGRARASLPAAVSAPPAVFTGRYAWRCQQPDALLALDVPLLEFINGVPLDILLVTPAGERAWTLKAPDTRIPVVED